MSKSCCNRLPLRAALEETLRECGQFYKQMEHGSSALDEVLDTS